MCVCVAGPFLYVTLRVDTLNHMVYYARDKITTSGHVHVHLHVVPFTVPVVPAKSNRLPNFLTKCHTLLYYARIDRSESILYKGHSMLGQGCVYCLV